MRCGISTACFYPEETHTALERVVRGNAPVTELFLNTFSEMEPAYVARLKRLVQGSGTQVVSVHPFTGAVEGFFFATQYEKRTRDGMELYRRFYEICGEVGADKLVFHGDHDYNKQYFPLEAYCERFMRLAALGREHGVTLCHENVAYCRVNTPQDVLEMRALLGEDAAFVLDLKQARRKGEDWPEMVRAMGTALRHVHISDGGADDTCLLPGSGGTDFTALGVALRAMGYAGDAVIELYRDNFGDEQELLEAMRLVQDVL